jgi:hypothetical protein
MTNAERAAKFLRPLLEDMESSGDAELDETDAEAAIDALETEFDIVRDTERARIVAHFRASQSRSEPDSVLEGHFRLAANMIEQLRP